jgi:hypothetical protein
MKLAKMTRVQGADEACVFIFPRRKCCHLSQPTPTKGRSALRIDAASLENVFGMPLRQAAQALGISITSVKMASRSLGIQKWPYKKNRQAGSESTVRITEDNLKTPPSTRASSQSPTSITARVAAQDWMTVNDICGKLDASEDLYEENQEIEPGLEAPEFSSGQSSCDGDDLSWLVSIPAFQGWKSGWDLEDLLLNPL